MAAVKHVRVIFDYSYRVGDIGRHVRRGDECVVLCEYDENWLYVCKVDDTHHMYVPRQFVEPVSEHDVSATVGRTMSLSSHDEDHPRYAAMSRHVSASDAARSVRRVRAASTPTARVSNDTDEIEHVMTRGSVINEASDDSDDNDKDYVPFNPTEQSPPARPAGEPRLDYCNTAPPRPRRLHSVDENVLASTGHPSTDELKTKTEPTRELSEHVRTRSSSLKMPTSAVSTALHRLQSAASVASRGRSRASASSDVRLSSPVTNNNDFTSSLLDKEGAVQCRHSRENGRLVSKQEWTNAYLVLTGGILSFYKNENAARKKPDGHYNMPNASIVLQGSNVQMAGRNQNTLDIVLITSATNTQYFIEATDVNETRSWCHHLKHNIAVLLAERTARMRLAKPVSTFTATSPTIKSPRGIVTFFESEMSRIAELLRDLLLRRPSREDLQRRGIYKEPMFGSSLADVCAKDHSNVPRFLVSCFTKIEQQGLDTEGIYRHSGGVARIQKLRIQANQGDYDVSDYEVHVVAGAVKLFFRELSQPLIPTSLLDRFIATYRVDDEQVRLTECATLIRQLSEPHRDTLLELLKHLERVSSESGVNQMTAHNLAIVFGPTLMWSTSATEQSLSTTVVMQGKLVEYFISERRQLVNVVSSSSETDRT